MNVPCCKFDYAKNKPCEGVVAQESQRTDHIGMNGVAWRAYCKKHLAEQVSKYPLLIRPVGRPQGTVRG